MELYELQKDFCKRNNLPLFASQKCNHTYPWVKGDLYGKLQSFDQMMIEKYGQDAHLKASSEHIISCPSCSRSWCD